MRQWNDNKPVEIDKVKELVQLMIDNDLSCVSLRDGAEEITLNRRAKENLVQQFGMGGNGMDPTFASNPPAAAALAENSTVDEPPPQEDLVPVNSPMVGTMYISPSPDAKAFVEIGSAVKANSVVCIIEAMKVFNEIHADVSGTIEKILVTNQQAVEYGQPLFMVRRG